jgi:hypothetical protein
MCVAVGGSGSLLTIATAATQSRLDACAISTTLKTLAFFAARPPAKSAAPQVNAVANPYVTEAAAGKSNLGPNFLGEIALIVESVESQKIRRRTEFLFYAQQLVVLRNAVSARCRTSLNLSDTAAHG